MKELFLFSVLCFLFSVFCSPFSGSAQNTPDPHRIYFISDVQEPMQVEKIISKPYRNEEATDSLYSDIIRHHPENVLLLGDLSSKGSNEKAWVPLDIFLHTLKKINTTVYAIPGNHEYMGEPKGMVVFRKHFPEKWLHGYLVNIDSVAFVMLNSNVRHLTDKELLDELKWYKSIMDSLDADQNIRGIIVCTHHPPYSNSKVVGSSEPMQRLIVPRFEQSGKSILLISGHSHNLEYFSDRTGKHFLVIGGGGGIAQPLLPMDKRIHKDLLDQNSKPLYFYLIIEKNGNSLKLIARGFKRDFRFFESEIGTLTIN
jgi:Icc-related predicted phosphoesterase